MSPQASSILWHCAFSERQKYQGSGKQEDKIGREGQGGEGGKGGRERERKQATLGCRSLLIQKPEKKAFQSARKNKQSQNGVIWRKKPA